MFTQQLLLGKVVVLGSAVVVHTSLTGTFPLGDVAFLTREMLVFRTFGRLSLTNTKRRGNAIGCTGAMSFK